MWRRPSCLCYNALSNIMFYAVRIGRMPGIYQNWEMCKTQVNGFPGARYKKFKTASDAQAFIDDKSEENQQTATGNTVLPTILQVPQEFFVLGTKNIIQISDWNQRGHYLTKPSQTVPPTLKNTIPDLTVSATCNAKRNGDATDQPPSKRRKNGSQKYHGVAIQNGSVKTRPIDVYTDGACVGNGKDHAKAAIGVFWGPDHHMNVSERLPGRQTNNRAEIHAARRAIEQAKKMGRQEVRLFTDSQFLINAITKWIKRWKQNNWTLISGEPVVNREDFEQLEVAMDGMKVHWIKVAAHAGTYGNERADQLANLALKKPPVH